jgi:hypothetical protein
MGNTESVVEKPEKPEKPVKPENNLFTIQMKIKDIERECRNILQRMERNKQEMNRYYRENKYDNIKLVAKSIVQDRQLYIRYQKLLTGYNIMVLGLTGVAAQQYQQRSIENAMKIVNPEQQGGNTLDKYLQKYLKYESKYFNASL